MQPTMRAVRLEGPAHAVVREIPVPEPPDADWRLLRVEQASICATDRKWFVRGVSEPRTVGHEMVLREADGRLVGLHPEVPCRNCELCADGWDNRCRQRYSVGLQVDGALAEWVAVREDRIVDVGDLTADEAVLLEPVACCWHAADMLGTSEGKTALVVGAGAMGIISMWVLQAMGARVVVVQRSPERRSLAAELGADAAIGPDDDLAEALGEEPDVAIVSAPGAEPLVWALERVAVGGKVHALAGTPGGMPVDANLVHYRHLTLMGSTGSALKHYLAGMQLVAKDLVPLKHLPVEKVGFDEAPHRLAEGPQGSALKTIVRPS